jgi:hypothetical protein
VDGGQRRERQPLDATAEVEERVDERAHLVGALAREQGDVSAGAEHLAVASHEQCTDVSSVLDRTDRVEKVADQFLADQVQGWVVEREDADCPVLREVDPRLPAHVVGTFCRAVTEQLDVSPVPWSGVIGGVLAVVS